MPNFVLKSVKILNIFFHFDFIMMIITILANVFGGIYYQTRLESYNDP